MEVSISSMSEEKLNSTIDVIRTNMKYYEEAKKELASLKSKPEKGEEYEYELKELNEKVKKYLDAHLPYL